MDNSDLFVCIDHIGLAVPDMDEALRLHVDVMGWRLLHREQNQEQGVDEAMLGTGAQGDENAMIQLLAPLSPESAVGKFIEKNGGRGGIQHIAYRVADMDAVDATLRERGATLLYPAPKSGTGGARINFIHPKSTGGVLLEITEPPAAPHH
ncbi:methylmalonyl-CoA epimerase [Propioniciclava tarda]|uniref:Methylmalonyl-CoA epimerase n=1 Tax=Propioniciclava tarda TaxID=433330 RepID=A0A4Q9KMZ3_PROTD|nr:methylmalonyl-CoA epimerase [Propioniciclava tarda]TBT95139.1 methylmalonyl-CoA epimerase [Propioniciclava tarda]SMO51289.1 methylmalonyl-CoA epimerase [Propioniciclava tarda]HOA88701.1 methylmalonyl-CoA epimerase [Propioniciclava tarda]HQA30260.1 methylmalonyl-CoA epimerase [Propioniciclava tarda]HQD60081.1 methylmalonyl-CoA epimerase [Propioniciclava tarda]